MSEAHESLCDRVGYKKRKAERDAARAKMVAESKAKEAKG